MATVAIIGTLDTKGAEIALAKQLIEAAGCSTVVVDVGIHAPAQVAPDVTAAAVARAAGADLEALRRGNDRGEAMSAMARGAAIIAHELHEAGNLQAIFSLGGSGGASIAAAAMRALPIGVPKLMVSTVAGGNVAPYVGTSDLMMMYPVIDFAGLNPISERVIANAAAAIAAMAKSTGGPIVLSKPIIAITMFGVTTPGATAAREWLEAKGYDVLIFHANGAGGRSMEALMRGGLVRGVLDLTTTELADEVVGGTLSAGPERLDTAGSLGLPQVVSLGALDMVNFGPLASVPEKFRGRKLYQHNPTVTLMRTTPEECAILGALIGEKLNRAKGPTAVFIPVNGISAISQPGGVFFDPAADAALIEALRRTLDPRIACTVVDTDVNDGQFARTMAETLDGFLRGTIR